MPDVRLYNNGIKIDNVYYIGYAKIITPDGKFPEVLPPVVLDAMDEKSDYYIIYDVEKEEITVEDHGLRNTKIIEVCFGDEKIPLIFIPLTNKWYGAYRHWLIVSDKEYIGSGKHSRKYTAQYNNHTIEWYDGAPWELIKKTMEHIIENNNNPMEFHIEITTPPQPLHETEPTVTIPPAPKPKKVLPPQKPPGPYVEINEYEGCIYRPNCELPIRVNAESYEYSKIFDGQVRHYRVLPWPTRKKFVEKAYEMTGWKYLRIECTETYHPSSMVIKRLHKPVDADDKIKVRDLGNAVLFIGDGRPGAVTKDGKLYIANLRRDMADDELREIIDEIHEKLIGDNKYITIKMNYKKWDFLLIYDSPQKYMVTKLKLDYNYNVTGYILDHTGWRYVKDASLPEIIDLKKILGARRYRNLGPIPIDKVKKISSESIHEVEYEFEHVKLFIKIDGRKMTYKVIDKKTGEKMRTGECPSTDYFTVLGLIERDSWFFIPEL